MILAIKLVYEQRLLLTCGGLNGLMISPNDVICSQPLLPSFISLIGPSYRA